MLNSQIKLKRLRNPRIKRKRKYPILTGVPAGKVVLFAIDSHEQPHPNRTPSLLHVLPQKLHRRIYRTITQPQINNRELKQEEKENHSSAYTGKGLPDAIGAFLLGHAGVRVAVLRSGVHFPDRNAGAVIHRRFLCTAAMERDKERERRRWAGECEQVGQ